MGNKHKKGELFWGVEVKWAPENQREGRSQTYACIGGLVGAENVIEL